MRVDCLPVRPDPIAHPARPRSRTASSPSGRRGYHSAMRPLRRNVALELAAPIQPLWPWLAHVWGETDGGRPPRARKPPVFRAFARGRPPHGPKTVVTTWRARPPRFLGIIP